MENTKLIRFFEVKLDDSEKKKELLKDVNINKIYHKNLFMIFVKINFTAH